MKQFNNKFGFLRRLLSGLAAYVATLCALFAADRLQYSVIPLGTSDEAGANANLMIPYRMNDKGDVIGSSTRGLFLYRDGKSYQLQAAGDPTEIFSMSINNRRVVAGLALNFQQQQSAVSFTLSLSGPNRNWDISRASILPLTRFAAWDINDNDAVLGSFSDEQGETTGFGIYQSGTVNTLPDPPSGRASWVSRINNRGQVIGVAVFGHTDYGFPEERAVIWSGERVDDLGVLPGFSISTGVAINNLGHAVGYCYNPSTFIGTTAFLYRDGIMNKLPSPPGSRAAFANNINDAGQILIWSHSGRDDSLGTPWLYSEGVFYNLREIVTGASGWLLLDLYNTGINNRGEMIGCVQYRAPSGQWVQQGILLRPRGKGNNSMTN